MHLKDKIALVTGASRGVGRGIALQLGSAGATIYITGRKIEHGRSDDLPTLEQTAREVTERGGKGVAVFCDHSNPEETKHLFERIEREQNGKLDILVNNAYSAVEYMLNNIGKSFWEMDASAWDEMNNVGLRNNYICAVYAARMMTKKRSGLIINVSSLCGLVYMFNVPHCVGHAALDRMSADCARELKAFNVACISLWPGAVHTELMLKYANVLFDNEALAMLKPMYDEGETPEYAGKCVVHLAQDPNIMQKSGCIWITGDLGDLYNFTDITGKKPKNCRSVKSILEFSNWNKTASWIPEWVKVPWWAIQLLGSKM